MNQNSISLFFNFDKNKKIEVFLKLSIKVSEFSTISLFLIFLLKPLFFSSQYYNKKYQNCHLKIQNQNLYFLLVLS